MTEPSTRSRDFYGYCFTLGVSVIMLIYMLIMISSRCEQIFRSGDDCGVGIGWGLVGLAFIVIAIWSGYRLYTMQREI
ncbi:MAG: hypothetical protein Q7V05_02860 [Methanoregula sp.]|nr:hypothetical protein [Methanoregula sp.]